MNIRQCKLCRKNFQGVTDLCPTCVQELDRKYVKLRNHLDEKPSSTMRELTEDTGIDEKSILFLVREGRLMLKTASADIKCIRCGAAVVSGRYCEACKAGIMQSLSSTHEQSKTGAAPGKAPRPDATRPGYSSAHESVRDGDNKVELHTRSTRK